MARSAFDCISPALSRTTDTCFRPFRIGVWARLALIVFLAGEAGGSFDFSKTIHHHPPARSVVAGAVVPPDALHWIIIGIALAAIIGIPLFVLFAWLNARARFVLMESVIRRDCRLAEMWSRWGMPSLHYFAFNLVLGVISISSILFILWKAFAPMIQNGDLRNAGWQMIFMQVLPWMAAFCAIVIVVVIVSVFAKDFLVPVLGFEQSTLRSGIMRLKGIMSDEPAEFTLYIIAKIILAVVCLFVRMMLFIPVVIVMAIPIGVLSIPIVFIYKSNVILGGILIALGVAVALPLFIFMLALIAVPFGVFFESFALEFFADRFPPLAAVLHPVPAPVAPVMMPPPQPAPAM